MSGAVPPPGPVLWSGQPGFRDPCVPGAVDAGVWTKHRPHSVRPCGLALLACGGGGKGVPGGGVPSTVVRGAWCQALSLPRPPVLWGGQPGFRDPRVPGAVGAGVGTQHRPHSVRPCGPALLAVGVAEGRRRGGVPSTIVRGAWGQALSLSRLPAHCWAGCRGSLGVCGVCGVCAVRVVVRGAALPLVLRCSPLRCLGAVLCSPCARRVPSPVRAPCSSAGYPLFLSRLRCSLPCPLPFSLTCAFSLPPLCCVSRSFSLSARASSFEPA